MHSLDRSQVGLLRRMTQAFRDDGAHDLRPVDASHAQVERLGRGARPVSNHEPRHAAAMVSTALTSSGEHWKIRSGAFFERGGKGSWVDSARAGLPDHVQASALVQLLKLTTSVSIPGCDIEVAG